MARGKNKNDRKAEEDLIRGFKRAKVVDRRVRAQRVAELYRNEPWRATMSFIRHFRFDEAGRPTLSSVPPDDVLEVVAECFRRYWTAPKGTLDSAFKIGGRRTPRDRLRFLRNALTVHARYPFYLEEERVEKLALRGGDSASQRAIKRIAEELELGEETVRSMLRRRRRPRRE